MIPSSWSSLVLLAWRFGISSYDGSAQEQDVSDAVFGERGILTQLIDRDGLVVIKAAVLAEIVSRPSAQQFDQPVELFVWNGRRRASYRIQEPLLVRAIGVRVLGTWEWDFRHRRFTTLSTLANLTPCPTTDSPCSGLCACFASPAATDNDRRTGRVSASHSLRTAHPSTISPTSIRTLNSILPRP